ncbi:MAG: PQQ-like beta-propeller repeat protein [bacterium]|nr:PQQ-like beta-propeller repeat protein [bacterium]
MTLPSLRSAALATVFGLASTALAQDWPQWRGPAGNGVAPRQERDVPLEWSKDRNVKWRTPLAEPGNGSPIVTGNRVFVTMPEDAEGRGRSLYCFDRTTGKERWHRTVTFDRTMPTHKTNPYCSTTPACDGERVIVWHASAGLCCYDLDGKELWQRDLGEFRHQWGHGTSPVLHDDVVLLHSGPGAKTFVAAFDRKTGKTRWRADEPPHLTPQQIEKKRLTGSWCTPIVHAVDGRDLVLCGHPTRIVGYDAGTGEIAWWCNGISAKRGDLTYSSPVIADELCMIVGGYVGPMIGVRMDGKDDVTASHRAWHRPEEITNCASGVFAAGVIFIPEMGGFVRCVNPKDGTTRWRARVGRGNTWGSIVAAAGRLYLMNQNGTTTVFAPDPDELRVLTTNSIDEPTNSTLAIAGGDVFLRTHEALYCISTAR